VARLCQLCTRFSIGFKGIIRFSRAIAGAAAYFAWPKLGDLAAYYLCGKENKEVRLVAKISGFTLASINALNHLMDNLTPIRDIQLNETYGS